MAKKIKDLCIKTGEYQDNNTGERKFRWKDVGALMQSDDGSMFILMDRTFNPAGVPSGNNNNNTILISAFDVDRNTGGHG